MTWTIFIRLQTVEVEKEITKRNGSPASPLGLILFESARFEVCLEDFIRMGQYNQPFSRLLPESRVLRQNVMNSPDEKVLKLWTGYQALSQAAVAEQLADATLCLGAKHRAFVENSLHQRVWLTFIMRGQHE